jgi:hypothetical protein
MICWARPLCVLPLRSAAAVDDDVGPGFGTRRSGTRQSLHHAEVSRQRHRSRRAHAPGYVDHLTAVLGDLDRNLRVHVEAVLEPARELLFDRPDGEPGGLDPPDQRKVESPVGIDGDGSGEVGFAEHGHGELVLRADHIFG